MEKDKKSVGIDIINQRNKFTRLKTHLYYSYFTSLTKTVMNKYLLKYNLIFTSQSLR